MTTKMQAALLDDPKQPFRVASVARPEPKSGEVLVRIKASGVNPLDLKIRAGQAAHARHPQRQRWARRTAHLFQISKRGAASGS
jgi:NADPH:quinone reductase-like Zn-dependent oxidoreductase